MTTLIFDEVLNTKFIKNWLVFHTCKIIINLACLVPRPCVPLERRWIGVWLMPVLVKISYDIITSHFMLASFCSLRVRLATQSSVCEVGKSCILRHT